MRGKKAKILRKQVKDIDPWVQYNTEDEAPPEYDLAVVPGRAVKVLRGIPREMMDTCGRYAYQNLK